MQIQRLKYKDLEQTPFIKLNREFKEEFSGSTPAPFIGRHGYPKVNIGLLSPQYSGEMSKYDSPRFWSKTNLAINAIAGLRCNLVNSRQQALVKNPKILQNKTLTNAIINQSIPNKFLDICQEVGMAKRSAEIEVSLTKKPTYISQAEKEVIPFGPQGEIKKARLTANTAVDSRVEAVVRDTDLKASDALLTLHQKGFEETALNKLLSVGNLGLKNNRRLVPTRWSITAVDDTIGKKLITEIKNYPEGEYLCYFGGGWGNYYLILFFSEDWSFELFETYLQYQVNQWSKSGNFYSTDYGDFSGRKTYAQECAGGYYACRLPVLEKMKELKRQHSCLALRFITPEYNIPLGAWVCREATRKSLQEKAISFSTKELMLKYAAELLQKKFGFDINLLLKESKLLKKEYVQTRLSIF